MLNWAATRPTGCQKHCHTKSCTTLFNTNWPQSSRKLALGIAGLVAGLPAFVEFIGTLGDAVLSRIKHEDDQYWKKLDLVIKVNKSQIQEICHFIHKKGTAAPEDLKYEVVQIFQAIRDTLTRLLTLFAGVGPGNQILRSAKLSAAQKKKIEAEVSLIEEWNKRILMRTLAFVSFGGGKLPPKMMTDSDDEHKTLALRKVESLRDSIDESLKNARNESQVLLNQTAQQDGQALPDSQLMLQTALDASEKPLVVEYRKYNDDAREHEIRYHHQVVCDVAKILRQADPSFMGLLYCKGFVWDRLKCRFELHFPRPPGLHNPRTLLNLLTDPETKKKGVRHALNQRVALAKSIVTAIFFLHAANFVHKQIRPDNVLVFEDELTALVSTSSSGGSQASTKKLGYPYVLGKPFLVGFDNVRKADAASLMLPEEDWKRNIYLSPERQRLQRGDEFRMQHDIYSLGVVLIEIAYWASFQDKGSTKLGHIVWKGSILRTPEDLKKTYLGLATGAVSRLMGQKYADAVIACLTGLQSESGLSFEDEDGIVIGTRYITEVIKKLEEISM
ncbi:hypothetical protein EDB81DRAFT_841724 [Dactylonectria macrodidyma]|uniref:Protein kinase domain-containing protein n=1 Tax=Dactylonectria macrodidyma TaxID=307937 RepID=A0A9P9F7D4_9HYPO|nr:hypothetical protein EDB81DRAFT_841724 [Dactylonectria macrodidyma]